jgi:predicted CoA-binding protein
MALPLTYCRLVRSAREILAESTTIAVVGASRDPNKEAHAVPRQIMRHGWRVIPVNPYADELWGVRCYPTLADIGEHVDLVNVFRPARPSPRARHWQPGHAPPDAVHELPPRPLWAAAGLRSTSVWIPVRHCVVHGRRQWR